MTKPADRSARNSEIALRAMAAYVDRHFSPIAQQLRHDVKSALLQASKEAGSLAEENLQALRLLDEVLSKSRDTSLHIRFSNPDPRAFFRACDDSFQSWLQSLDAARGNDSENA